MAADARVTLAPLPRSPVPKLTMPTIEIPSGCLCTWAVTRPGPGRACLSSLRFVNRLCPSSRAHYGLAEKQAQAQAAEAAARAAFLAAQAELLAAQEVTRCVTS